MKEKLLVLTLFKSLCYSLNSREIRFTDDWADSLVRKIDSFRTDDFVIVFQAPPHDIRRNTIPVN